MSSSTEPIGSELNIELAGLRLERDEFARAREEDSRRNAAVTGPIGDSPKRREAIGKFIAPDLLAGFGLERNDAITRRHIHDPIDDDRRDLMEDFGGAGGAVHCGDGNTGRGPQAIGPDLLQLSDVGGVDLGQRGVTRAREIAVVGGPVGIRTSRSGLLGQSGKANRHADDAQDRDENRISQTHTLPP
jgi:hypothetical protein